MINAYTGEYNDNSYYFFIKSGGSFIGILLISDTDTDGDYSYNPKSSDSKMYFIMDPNYPYSYVGISYDSPYYPYEYFISQTDSYNWSITAVDKDII